MLKIKLFNSSILLRRLCLLNLCAFIIAVSSVTSVAVAGENSYNIIEVARVDIEAEGCSYLGEVWGTTDWGKSSKNARRHKPEDKALKMAVDMDATHLVWNEHSGGSDSYPHASADAYRCESAAKPSDIAKKENRTGNQIN